MLAVSMPAWMYVTIVLGCAWAGFVLGWEFRRIREEERRKR